MQWHVGKWHLYLVSFMQAHNTTVLSVAVSRCCKTTSMLKFAQIKYFLIKPSVVAAICGHLSIETQSLTLRLAYSSSLQRDRLKFHQEPWNGSMPAAHYFTLTHHIFCTLWNLNNYLKRRCWGLDLYLSAGMNRDTSVVVGCSQIQEHGWLIFIAYKDPQCLHR